MLDFIIKYWVEWLCGLVALGVTIFARRYIKLEKKATEEKWQGVAKEAKKEVSEKLLAEIKKETERSTLEDKKIGTEIEVLNNQMENLSTGVLSIQGKQFRDTCLMLLEEDHKITIQEYEQFEDDYIAYKALGGNHRGDALHARVVEKFQNGLKK